MKPPPFTYHAPRTVAEALDTLAEVGDDGKVLAGGQSLVPLLNMRLAAPEHLVDIGGIGEVDRVETTARGVRVAAGVRQASLEADRDAGAVQPLLPRALGFVAHPVVRNRGTVVGSLAHADPAAELPAVLALVDGDVEVGSRKGRRTVPARELFVGPLESSLDPTELALSAFFPALPPRSGVAFAEMARRHGDFALCGSAAVLTLDADLRVAAARVSYLSVGPTPLVLDLTEACGRRSPAKADWAAAAAEAQRSVAPGSDIHAGAEYRRHLVGVLTARVLREAAGRAEADAVQHRDPRAGGRA